MRPDTETIFKVCSGYVLSSIRKHLQEQGFSVKKVEITGELQDIVERGYIRWCVEVGVPAERFEENNRFWTLLDWVAEKPRIREKLVKTGWKSWDKKWRGRVFKKGAQKEAREHEVW